MWILLRGIGLERDLVLCSSSARIRHLALCLAASATLTVTGQCIETAQAQDPPLVEFNELFMLVDTVRLDASVLLGGWLDMDVDSNGNFAITDSDAGSVHLFSATGEHLLEMTPEACDPGRNARLQGSRFVGDELILTSGAFLVSYVFDRSGHCILGSRSAGIASPSHVCSRDSTIYVLSKVTPQEHYVRAFSTELELVREYPVPAPRWPVLTEAIGPIQGIGCFEDDAWFIRMDSFDAIPVTQAMTYEATRPAFYRERKRDLPDGPDLDKKYGAISEGTVANALFELEVDTRAVHYGGASGPGNVLRIVNHSGRFSPVATSPPDHPETARNGMLYYLGESERLPDGEVGNPVIVRYRFLPPNKTGN